MAASIVLFRLDAILVAEDPLEPADAVYVLGGMRMSRALEAGALHLEGWAPRIVLSVQMPERAELALVERGLPYEMEAERQRTALVHFGVPRDAIETVDEPQANTAQEAATLAALVRARGWQRVIVVTSPLHTRRAGLAMRRRLDGTGARVILRASRYELEDDGAWWESRISVRTAVFEFQRYVAYWIGIAD